MLRQILKPPGLVTLASRASIPCGATRGLRTTNSRLFKQSELLSRPNSSQASNQNASNTPPEQPPPSGQQQKPSMENILANISDKDNLLLAPVHIPEDPNAILKSDHPARNILAESGIVVQRQIEMMNILIGFEQANRYVILDPHGNHIGYIAEHDGSFGKAMARQYLTTHRAFTTHVFDRHAKEVLRFHRPFSVIKTRIRVYDALEPSSSTPISPLTSLTTSANANDIEALQKVSQIPTEAMRLIGETHSEWAPLRRKYHLFLAHDLPPSQPDPISVETENPENSKPTENIVQPILKQFAYVDEPFLSWDFSLKDAEDKLIGSVNRGFRGFAREIFTDTGSYALRMDSVGLEQEAEKSHIISKTHQGERAYAGVVGGENDKSGMTLDQRAVMLATAVTVDFDYFSRHSHAGGMGFMPVFMGGGGEAAGGAAAGGAAGGVAGAGEAAGGVVVGGAGRAVGGAAGSIGAGEGAIAGAGTMAGYEAMQRGLGRDQAQQDASPQAGQPTDASPQAGQPYEQPYGQPSDPQSPQSGFPEGEAGSGGGDVWGDQDPWSEVSSNSGGGGGSEGGGGIFSTLWDSFFGGD